MTTSTPTEATSKEKRELLERIATSAQFRRSNRLRDMLLFLGERALDSNHPEVNEQEIGEKVFGRPPEYDRGQDNIVRVNASELRKRLESYSRNEGAQESVVVSMPRGGYRLRFQSRAQPVAQETQPVKALSVYPAEAITMPSPQPELAPVASRDSRSWLLPAIYLAIGLSVGFLASWLFFRGATTAGPGAATATPSGVAAFWSEFAPSPGDIDLVLPDASVNLTEQILGRPMSLSEYVKQDYLAGAQEKHSSAERIADIHEIFNHNIVTLGDSEAAQLLLSLTPDPARMHLTGARVYNADSLKRDSLILIGGQAANPWAALFENRMSFIAQYDSHHSQTYVMNRQPKPGEPTTYTVAQNQNALYTGYGVITYLPSPRPGGNVLILAGTDAQTTKAAAEFFCFEDKFEQLRGLLGGTRMPHFEAILRNSRVGSTSFNSEIIAVRTIPDGHS